MNTKRDERKCLNYGKLEQRRRKSLDAGVKVNGKGVAHSFRKKILPYKAFYIMFLPVIVYYIVFHYLPMCGILIAFEDFSFKAGIFGSKWVGAEHFNKFLTNGDFWIVMKNTVLISLLRTVFSFPAPIILALMINEVKHNAYKRAVQTITYLPHFISWIVISGMLYSLFSGSGAVNSVITKLGGNAVGFLSEEKYYRIFFIVSAIWKESGYSAIIYLAALSGVDQQLYEAASLDGANGRQQLFHITLPSIASTVSTMFILSFANVLSVGFEQTLALINSSVMGVAEVIDYYVYRVGLLQANNYSYSTAVGLFKSVISLALVLLTNWGAKKIDEESGLW